MGKNPSMIFKDLCRSARENYRAYRKGETTGIEEEIYNLTVRDGCFYVTYSEAIRRFLMEGYSEQKANKHISQWATYDLVCAVRHQGYKLLALSEVL